jgi:transcriptional regulator of arginine metabolism
MNTQKRERQDLILSLIGSEQIGRQDILAERLSQRGFHVTQASVSRDLEELGVVKVDGHYELPKTPAAVMEFGLRSLETAGDNLIVGKCDSGLASAITVRIDAANIDEIVGTIAGDDTIFIAVRDLAQQGIAIAKIWALFSV